MMKAFRIFWRWLRYGLDDGRRYTPAQAAEIEMRNRGRL